MPAITVAGGCMTKPVPPQQPAGLARDFLASFYQPGYSPFKAASLHAPEPVYAPGYPLQRDTKGRFLPLGQQICNSAKQKPAISAN